MELHPNSKNYVFSDSYDTVGYLLKESHFAQHYIDVTKGDQSGSTRLFQQKLTRGIFQKQWHGWVMIMGMGRCEARGVGRYGMLGAILHDGECVIMHQGRHSKVCSNSIASFS